MAAPILIDGSLGEGGGQVLRAALALSACTGQSVRLLNIRAGRKTPGLRAQHLCAVRALCDLCCAQCEGADQGSSELLFRPGLSLLAGREIIGDNQRQGGHSAAGRGDRRCDEEQHRDRSLGEYRYDVGTAGAVTLVAQALLPPLLMTPLRLRYDIRGGTHVAWSPPWEYLTDLLLPLVRAMGGQIHLHLDRHGFYPRGGGQVQLSTPGVGVSHSPGDPTLQGANAGFTDRADHNDRVPDSDPIRLTLERPPRSHIRIVIKAVVCDLPRSIAQRMTRTAAAVLRAKRWRAREQIVEVSGPHPGTYVFIRVFCHDELESCGGHYIGGGFTGLGRIRKPAEEVATEAAMDALAFLESEACCDARLADQLLLPALACGVSLCYTTPRFSGHLRTQAALIDRILGSRVILSDPGTVRVDATAALHGPDRL